MTNWDDIDPPPEGERQSFSEPDYDEMFASLVQSGIANTRIEICVCHDCGAMVLDSDAHVAWHDKVATTFGFLLVQQIPTTEELQN